MLDAGEILLFCLRSTECDLVLNEFFMISHALLFLFIRAAGTKRYEDVVGLLNESKRHLQVKHFHLLGSLLCHHRLETIN